jgi:hypothetical protein
MIQKSLINNLKKEIKEISEEYNYPNVGHAFVHFCTKLIFDLDDEEVADYCSVGIFGHDKGIDAIVPNDENNSLCIIQGKYSEKPKKFKRIELVDPQCAITFLSSPPTDISRPELLRAIQNYKDSLRKGWKIQLLLIVFGELTKDGQEYIASLKSQLPENHELEVYNLQDILDFYIQTIGIYSGRGPDLSLKNVKDVQIREREGLPRSIICTITGDEICKIVGLYRPDIFQLNVREFLRRTSVNKDIIRTLMQPDERKFFWYYNLGITAICDRFEIIQNQEIKVINFRIVNGCQTANILAENQDKLNDVEILLRLIETDDAELANKITVRNNTQNPIRGRDLFSQHYLQINIQKYFASRKPPIFYERRTGEWQSLPAYKKIKFKVKGKYQRVRNDDCAKAFMAFKLKKPSEAKMRKKDLFVLKENGGFYEDIFSDNTDPEELLLAFSIHQKIKEKIREFLRNYEGLPETEKKKLELRRSFLPHADTQLLAMFGTILEIKCRGELHPRQILEYLENNPQIFSNLYEKLLGILEIVIQVAKQAQGEAFNPRNYLVHPKTFDTIKKSLELNKETLLQLF